MRNTLSETNVINAINKIAIGLPASIITGW